MKSLWVPIIWERIHRWNRLEWTLSNETYRALYLFSSLEELIILIKFIQWCYAPNNRQWQCIDYYLCSQCEQLNNINKLSDQIPKDYKHWDLEFNFSDYLVIRSIVPISISWRMFTVYTIVLFNSEMNNYLARKTDMVVNSCLIIFWRNFVCEVLIKTCFIFFYVMYLSHWKTAKHQERNKRKLLSYH